jgi:hypothetical protein
VPLSAPHSTQTEVLFVSWHIEKMKLETLQTNLFPYKKGYSLKRQLQTEISKCTVEISTVCVLFSNSSAKHFILKGREAFHLLWFLNSKKN